MKLGLASFACTLGETPHVRIEIYTDGFSSKLPLELSSLQNIVVKFVILRLACDGRKMSKQSEFVISIYETIAARLWYRILHYDCFAAQMGAHSDACVRVCMQSALCGKPIQWNNLLSSL